MTEKNEMPGDNIVPQRAAFHLDAFDVKTMPWNRWVKRFETALSLFNADATKKRQLLLHYMGATTYNVLCDKVLPNEPETLQYEVIVSTLENHFNPKANEILENYRFHLRKQQSGESCEQFLVALRLLAKGCNFGDYLNIALRNQLVFGLKNQAIQNRLLEKKSLTLDDAINIAKAYEVAEKEGCELHQKGATSEVNKIHEKQRAKSPEKKTANTKGQERTAREKDKVIKSKQCFRCGNANHMANKCKFRDVVCHYCKKRGHLRKMCLKENKSVNVIEKQNQSEDYVYDLLKLTCNTLHPKVMCTLKINNIDINFEIDTGSPVTIISLKEAKKYFNDEPVIKSGLQLYSYCQTKLECLGYICVTVKAKVPVRARMYIVRSDRQPLLGREWLREIDIDWKNIIDNQLKERAAVNVLSSGSAQEKLQNILSRFPQLSAPNVGTITGHQERIYVKENAVPKFIKARRVPFPLMKAVENEIDKQVNEGLLVRVDKSEWATPIVAVPKRDGTVRICGDYKLTVNPALIVDEHPLPTIDELFSSMAGGEKFTKIDLAKAYLQLEIHPDNRELLTLSTHKGLFQPTRMMFGDCECACKVAAVYGAAVGRYGGR